MQDTIQGKNDEQADSMDRTRCGSTTFADYRRLSPHTSSRVSVSIVGGKFGLRATPARRGDELGVNNMLRERSCGGPVATVARRWLMMDAIVSLFISVLSTLWRA